MHKKLFIPGPVEVHPDLLAACAVPMVSHRAKDYEVIHEKAVKGVRAMLGATKGDVLLFTSSSTGAMEAAIRCLSKKRILSCSCGAFSERWFEMAAENERIRMLRDRLLKGMREIEEVFVNGDLERRVPHNLNVSFNFVEGESLIMAVKDIAVSSGSACTSASLEPSYVLRALGRSDELAHSSIRFTLGRFTTQEEVDYTVDHLRTKVAKLRDLSPLWEMHKEGIDLSTVQWAAH